MENEATIAGEATGPTERASSSAAVKGNARTKRPLSRWHAAGAHLLICVGVAAAVLGLMLVVWYPPPLFQVMGGSGLAMILIGVDVVIGPLLTLVVFRSGKPGLRIDLAIIAAFQVTALLYGCHVISLARPAYIVFVKDQFQVATALELAPERLAEAKFAQFRSIPWTGPALVFGVWPTDKADQQRLVNAVLTGEDLQHFPKYYAPYDQGKAEILAKAEPLSRVRTAEPEAARAIDAWLASSGADEQKLRYLRLRGRNGWVAVLIDRDTAQPVKMLVSELF
jgi:hypothetical protein